MTDSFSITLPLSENVATVQPQDDGTFKIWVEGNFTDGGYYVYSPVPTFEAAVRLIMTELWSDYLSNPLEGKSEEEIRDYVKKTNDKILRNAVVGPFSKILNSSVYGSFKTPHSEDVPQQESKIDHTPSSGNVFADLNLPKPDELADKSLISAKIQSQILKQDLSYSEAASKGGITRKELVDICSGNFIFIEIEKMKECLDKLEEV